MSILDGKRGTAAVRKAAPAAPARDYKPDWEQMARLSTDLATATKEIERLTGELTAAQTRTAEAETSVQQAREETARERTRADNATAAIATAQAQTARVEAERDAARTEREVLRTQLEAALAKEQGTSPVLAQIQEALQALPGKFTQITESIASVNAGVTAIASRPPSQVEPPTYEMQVTHRDGSNRPQTIRLRPVKKE